MVKVISDLQIFKHKALQWASQFDAVCYLESNSFKDKYSKFDTLIAIGVKAEIALTTGNAFDKLTVFRRKHPGWITGFFGYDLKNETENLSSNNPDHLHFPDLYFFAPQYLLIVKGNGVEIIGDDDNKLFDVIWQQELSSPKSADGTPIKSRFTKSEYLDTVKKIREHIAKGNIYVTNFCQEFYAEKAVIDPVAIFSELNQVSPNPFASFFKWKDNYIICASPERFLAKRDEQLISQPIKGTIKRGADIITDDLLKQQLRNHTKELQENVMVVDLVRNDLTRSAKPGSVTAVNLYDIQSFRQLHQMVSTVTCEIAPDVSTIKSVKNSFPMGSMTGAPKVSAMQLMEHYERSKRGVYSGAIGYFDPEDDFDFNVVIRSILYNSNKEYLSFHVGSAITYHADPEKEYEECLLKAKAIMQVLGQP